MPQVMRKRAYSEVTQPIDSQENLGRVLSDSDLSRINKEKTFQGAETLFDTGNLLARVVNALGSIGPLDEDGQSVLDMGMDGGIHGFSDSQILASERTWSGWSLAQSDGSYANPPLPRARAASDFRVPSQENFGETNDWTWNGNNTQIQEFLRKKARNKKSSLYRSAFNSNNKFDAPNPNTQINIPASNGNIPQTVNHTLLHRINPFKKHSTIAAKRNSISVHELEAQKYLERTSRGRESRISLPKQYLSTTAHGRASVFSILSTTDEANNDVLERTTIADLIRALEVVHTKASTDAGTPLLDDYFGGPKRKMGTASLTPPKMPSLLSVMPSMNANASARRGSLRPLPSYTTVFNSKSNQKRRQSSHVIDIGDKTFARRLSVRPTHPPPYMIKESPKPLNRRFSVRPTNLSTPPGQAPPLNPAIQASSTLQRRLSLRPSPLTRGSIGHMSGRFSRINEQQTVSAQNLTSRLQIPGVQLPPPSRNPLWRPAQLHARTRHGSLSELFEKNERKRTDSK